MNSRVLRPLTERDLEDVVATHRAALPDDVLPTLGIEVLRIYYTQALADGSQYLFGVEVEGKIVGFCLLSVGHVGLLQMFRDFKVILALLRLAILHPWVLYNALMQTLYGLPLEDGTAEISFIAVSPEAQGASHGTAMLGHAAQYCCQHGIAYIRTKTANEKLRDYYVRQHGAQELRSFDVFGKHYSVLHWPVAESIDP